MVESLGSDFEGVHACKLSCAAMVAPSILPRIVRNPDFSAGRAVSEAMTTHLEASNPRKGSFKTSALLVPDRRVFASGKVDGFNEDLPRQLHRQPERHQAGVPGDRHPPTTARLGSYPTGVD